jgi:HK97 family phage portal protein
LSKPNHYQTHIDFKESWMISKLRTGNTFVLKQRDGRGIVSAMYVLDPMRVQPLVATDGSVFYRLSADVLSGLEEGTVVVPASEIIHDRMNCLFHPLIGVSPLFASALSAGVGIEINRNSGRFFLNGAKISGIISVPGSIDDDSAKKLTDDFNSGYTGENAGKVAVLGDNMKFTQLTMSATDAQLIDQLKMSGLDVCTTFHVPPFKIGIGQMPSFENIEALNQQYYSECLQSPIEKMEQLLEEGLAIDQVSGKDLDIVLDINRLLRMDQKTQMATLGIGTKTGIVAPDEARANLNLPPVPGGKYPYLQQQNFSLEALAKRDALPDPFVLDKPTVNPTPSPAGSVAEDPALKPGKAFTAEVIDVEFTVVRELMAPLAVPPPALPAPIQKAA